MAPLRKILIIEDSRAQAAVLAGLVKQLGFEAVVYNEIKTGITQLLQREQPALVLLDLMLVDSEGNPVADGFKICREIKRHFAQIPVVVVTAEGEDDAYEWAVLQGADAFLQKPFVPDDLKQVIGEVLGSESS